MRNRNVPGAEEAHNHPTALRSFQESGRGLDDGGHLGIHVTGAWGGFPFKAMHPDDVSWNPEAWESRGCCHVREGGRATCCSLAGHLAISQKTYRRPVRSSASGQPCRRSCQGDADFPLPVHPNRTLYQGPSAAPLPDRSPKALHQKLRGEGAGGSPGKEEADTQAAETLRKQQPLPSYSSLHVGFGFLPSLLISPCCPPHPTPRSRGEWGGGSLLPLPLLSLVFAIT